MLATFADASNNCSVPTCVKDPNHFAFLLPTDNERARIWMIKCGIKTNYVGTTAVCEAHFNKALINHNFYPKRLKRGAIPTLNLPTLKNTTKPLKSQRATKTKPVIPSNTIPNIDISNQINYRNLMENIIVKSLNAPPSKIKILQDASISNQSTDIEPVQIEEKSGTLFPEKKNYNDKSEDTIINSMVLDSSSITNIETVQNENSDGRTKRRALNATRVDSSLTDPNYAIKIITELQQKIEFISTQVGDIKMLAVNIYLKCPQGYEMLHKILQLPSVSELKSVLDCCTISTDNGTQFASILQYKSEMMSLKQKHCIICIGTIDVRKNIYYDIKRDKLIGVCEINNIQKPIIAHKVLVLTVQGLETDWKQPIDIAYLSIPKVKRTEVDDNLAYVDQWIERNISNLLTIGFNVRALVCDADYQIMAKSSHNEKYPQIPYIYDIMSLLKWFIYIFLSHDYVFAGAIAKMQHILDYFELDSKNIPRLSPKLTEKTIKPASIENVTDEDVMEIISLKTAAAINTYINLKALKPNAISTVQLITKMSILLEVLYSNKICDYASIETYRQVLYDTISFFDDFKIVNRMTGAVVAAKNTFVPKIQLTMKGILMLYENNGQRNDDVKSIPIKRLSLDHMRSFFNRIKLLHKDGIQPTCKKVNFAFMQSTKQNVLRVSHDKKFNLDLETNLDEIQNIVLNFKINARKVDIPLDITIKSSEYNRLDFKYKDPIILLAGFLLKKCYDRHSDCDDMENYIFIVLQDTGSICKTILKEIQESVCVVPQESFIEFVEMMEIRFRSFMTKKILATQNGLITGLLKAIQPVTFPMPCSCFPIRYAKKLYLRVRIYDMLKYNNSCFTGCAFSEQYKYLVVNNF